MFIADNGFAAKCNNCYRLFIYASNEPKSVPARDLGDCRDNLRNARSVVLIVLCQAAETGNFLLRKKGD